MSTNVLEEHLEPCNECHLDPQNLCNECAKKIAKVPNVNLDYYRDLSEELSNARRKGDPLFARQLERVQDVVWENLPVFEKNRVLLWDRPHHAM